MKRAVSSILVLAIVCSLFSCGNTDSSSDDVQSADVTDMERPNEIELTSLSDGYFLNNNIELGEGINCMVATGQDMFDEYFGYGAVMGDNNTPPNLNNNYVLALATHAKDYYTELFIGKAVIEGNTLKVFCHIHQHEKEQGYESTPIALASVAKNDTIEFVSFYNEEKLIRTVQLK